MKKFILMITLIIITFSTGINNSFAEEIIPQVGGGPSPSGQFEKYQTRTITLSATDINRINDRTEEALQAGKYSEKAYNLSTFIGGFIGKYNSFSAFSAFQTSVFDLRYKSLDSCRKAYRILQNKNSVKGDFVVYRRPLNGEEMVVFDNAY